MKILFLTDNFPPEVNAPASRTFEHCREWVRAGHEVTVICTAPNFPKGELLAGYRNRLWQWEEMEGIRVLRVWTYITANSGVAKRTLDYLSFMVSGFIAGLFVRRPDVIVGTSPQFFTNCAGWMLSVFKRRSFVFELRDLWPESIKTVGAMKDSSALRLMERLELFLYRKSAAIVAVTESFKRDLVRRGIHSNKIYVVTNGVDLSRFKPVERDNDLLDQVLRAPGDPVLTSGAVEDSNAQASYANGGEALPAGSGSSTTNVCEGREISGGLSDAAVTSGSRALDSSNRPDVVDVPGAPDVSAASLVPEPSAAPAESVSPSVLVAPAQSTLPVSSSSPRSPFVVGYIGTHGLAHALETLLEAAKLLQGMEQDADRPIHFILLGDGARKESLKARAIELGLTNVSFLDSVPKAEVPRYWSLLDASIIHLRKADNFTQVIPSKLFECMGMGIPVLHGVAGESAEIVEREEVGLVFESENPQALCDCLLKLASDSDLYAGFQKNCLAAAPKYDRTVLARKMLKVLEGVGENGRKNHCDNDLKGTA